jgi:hypothetical protein
MQQNIHEVAQVQLSAMALINIRRSGAGAMALVGMAGTH